MRDSSAKAKFKIIGAEANEKGKHCENWYGLSAKIPICKDGDDRVKCRGISFMKTFHRISAKRSRKEPTPLLLLGKAVDEPRREQGGQGKRRVLRRSGGKKNQNKRIIHDAGGPKS